MPIRTPIGSGLPGRRLAQEESPVLALCAGIGLLAGTNHWEYGFILHAWIASTLACPSPDLVGQLLDLAGLADHGHRQCVFGRLVNLCLQIGCHLQQVGAFAGDLLLALLLVLFDMRTHWLLLILLTCAGVGVLALLSCVSACGDCAWPQSNPAPAANASTAKYISAQNRSGRLRSQPS